MMLLKNRLAAAALAIALPLGAAQATGLPPLSSDQHLHDELLAGFIADQIAKECSSISARKIKALNTLWRLADYARDKGYSDAEIKAYVEDKDEKAALKAEAIAWLAGRGAPAGNGAAHCTVGGAEIASKTSVGNLLRGY